MLRLRKAYATGACVRGSDVCRSPGFATGAGSFPTTSPWTVGTNCAGGTTTWKPFGDGGLLAWTQPIQSTQRRRRQEGHSSWLGTAPGRTLLHRGRCLLKQRLGTAPAPPHRHHPPRHHRLRYSPHPLPRRPLQRPLRRPLPRPLLQCPPRQHRLRFGPYSLLRHPLRCVPLRHPQRHHRLRFGPRPLLRYPLRRPPLRHPPLRHPLRHPLQHRLRRPLRPRRASHSLTCSRRC
jgi:hypothetical protein